MNWDFFPRIAVVPKNMRPHPPHPPSRGAPEAHDDARGGGILVHGGDPVGEPVQRGHPLDQEVVAPCDGKWGDEGVALRQWLKKMVSSSTGLCSIDEGIQLTQCK